MSKCVVKMVVDGIERTIKNCDNYVEANRFKLFKEETNHRENVEYKIV